MYDYSGLNKKLKEKGLKKSYLSEALGISSRTIAKIAKNEKIADNVLNRLCAFFACDKKDLVIEVSSNSVLRALREEKSAKISGSLYHETQVRLTYNSNRIEGSRLTEDQTRLIFETRTIGAGGADIRLTDDLTLALQILDTELELEDYYLVTVQIEYNPYYNFLSKELYESLQNERLENGYEVSYTLSGTDDLGLYLYHMRTEKNGQRIYWEIHCFEESIEQFIGQVLN